MTIFSGGAIAPPEWLPESDADKRLKGRDVWELHSDKDRSQVNDLAMVVMHILGRSFCCDRRLRPAYFWGMLGVNKREQPVVFYGQERATSDRNSA